MAKGQTVSISVIKRLPRYYRFLSDLLKKDIHRISSRELAAIMGLTASQIRQDLNCFGGFGQQGYGYNVDDLRKEIAHILGIDHQLSTVLIGVGNLGKALITHLDFEKRGFSLIGAFDKDINLIGRQIVGIPILDIADIDTFCRDHHPEVAILCIPKGSAQELADKLVSLGIRGFWNFSHYDLKLASNEIMVENVHLGDSLMTLCYLINNAGSDQEE